MQESWAVVIEWYLTHLEYASRGIGNYGEWNYHPAIPPVYPNDYAYQYWNISSYSGWYTSLFINIIDDIDDSSLFFSVPNDQVRNYTLPFIEQNLLKHIYGLSSLSTQLKNNKPLGINDGQIDLLLSSYQ